MAMFSGIVYYLSPSLPPQTRSELQRALNANGGQEVDKPGSATHILTDTLQFEGWEDVPDNIVRVTVSNSFIVSFLRVLITISAEMGASVYRASEMARVSTIIPIPSAISIPILPRRVLCGSVQSRREFVS